MEGSATDHSVGDESEEVFDSVCLWDLNMGNSTCTLTGQRAGVATAALSADGRQIASGAYDRGICLWAVVNLTNPMMMKGPLREFLPTPPQQVSIALRHLPQGRKAQKVIAIDF